MLAAAPRDQGLYLERVGSRAYVCGDAYELRRELAAAGGHWDARRRAWWIGVVQAHLLQEVIDQAGRGRVRGWRLPPDSEPAEGMRATIGLNLIVRGDIRTLRCTMDAGWIERYLMRKPWVARIVGRCPRYDLVRRWVRGKRDWSEADKKGRGIKVWYVLQPGIYEACEPLKRGERRWFLRVNPDGTHEEIKREEIVMDYQFTDLVGPDVVRVFYTRCAAEGLTLTSKWRSPALWRGVVAGGEVVAFYALLKHRPTTWRIKALYVVPDLRRQGLAQACVLDAMEQARAAGVSLEALALHPEVNPGWSVTGPARKLKDGRIITPMAWSPKEAE